MTDKEIAEIFDFSKMELWTCKICTYGSPVSFEHCRLCGADKEGNGAMSMLDAADRLVEGGIHHDD